MQPYVKVIDRFGASANVYISNDDTHKIVYEDSSGNKFYTEEFRSIPIEAIEQYAVDWSTGKRELA